VESCLRRINTWRVPSNFSASDWREEIRAHAAAAAWQAVCDYDPSLGVPLGVFVRQRVMTCAFTRYRQEWTYAARCVCDAEEEGHGSLTEDSHSCPVVHEPLRYALVCLPDADRCLIERLFFDGCTEADLAQRLGISQRGVSKRKQAVLQHLRRWLEASEQK
jgi:DNA-directed RNA polymerase specialized sigma24 family protein